MAKLVFFASKITKFKATTNFLLEWRLTAVTYIDDVGGSICFLPTYLPPFVQHVCMYVGSTNNINIVVTHPNIHTQANRPFLRFLFRRSGILRHERLKFYIDGNWGAAIAQWIRLLLSSSRPGVRVPSTLSALL